MIDKVDPAHDPGPLNEYRLRTVLRDSRYAWASKTHDRVQDAFERLIRERDHAHRRADDAIAEMIRGAELAEDLLEQLVETRKERWLTGGAGFLGGVTFALVAHFAGWL